MVACTSARTTASCTVSVSQTAELPRRPRALGEVLDEKEPALTRTDEIEIAVAVDVDDGNLHPATYAAAVVDQMSDPLDSTRPRAAAPARLRLRTSADWWCRTIFVPIDAKRLTLTGIMAVVRHVPFAGHEVE